MDPMQDRIVRVFEPRHLHPAFEEAFNQRNRPQVDSLFRADALLVLPTGEVVEGRPRYEAMTQLLDLDLKIRIRPHRCYVRNEVALLVSDYVLEGTGPAGEPFFESGTATDVAVRNEDGQWQIAIDNPPGTSLPRGNEGGPQVDSP